LGTPQPRYDGLDAIRAGAMLLGLAYHATYAWLPGVGPWYFVADGSPVAELMPVTGFLHSFRMQLFFALSGFFSHLVFERRGARGFLADRSRRLVIPFVVALPLVLGLDVALRSWAQSRGLMSPQFADGARFLPHPRHLWFLVYLFTLCVLAWAAPRWELPARALKTVLRFPLLLALLLTALTCAGLWLHPDNRPDLAMWPLPFELLHFGLFYAVGWWLWPAREVLEPLRRQAPFLLAGGIALGMFIFRGPLQWELQGKVLAGAVAWLMTLGAFGLAFRVEAKERGWLRFLVESSYWVYLVHFPVVQALQLVFAQTSAPGLLEYLAAIVLTFGFAVVTFVVFVWRTPLGPWLGVRSATR
jgi:glucans biosynthesis protein C